MKRLLYSVSFILLSTASSYAIQERDDSIACLRGDAHLLYQSNWHMLEDIFITQPTANVNRVFGVGGLVGVASLTAGIGSYFGMHKLLNYINFPTGRPFVRARYPFIEDHQNQICVGTSIGVGILFYKTLKSTLHELAEVKQLSRLVKQWHEAKDLCPTEIHAPIQKLASMKEGAEYQTQLRETVRLIKSAIHARFHEKYLSSKSFFEGGKTRFNFNMNIDIVRIFEKIANIFF